MSEPRIVIFDYGSGNLRSAQRALERVGARVDVTADAEAAYEASGLMVPGVGAYAACMSGFRAADGAETVRRRLAAGRPVLGVCVGLQILFDRGLEHGEETEGLGLWPGTVERLRADVLPRMGWDTVAAAPGSSMLRGVEDEYFYFVHSYGVLAWESPAPTVSWSTYGTPVVAAVEDGPLWATQFHPEKSAEAGLALLRNWVEMLG